MTPIASLTAFHANVAEYGSTSVTVSISSPEGAPAGVVNLTPGLSAWPNWLCELIVYVYVV